MQQKLRSLARAIAAEQQPDGSFISLSAPAGSDLVDGTRETTIFATAMVADLIAPVDLPELAETKARALAYLLSQRSEHWTFGYYPRLSPEAMRHPYPDDWDDTSLALAAIHALDDSILGGAEWAKITQLLAATENQEGGPYGTWIVGPAAEPAWRDVDLAVNCNIAWLLARLDVELDSLKSMALDADSYTSKYYPNDLMVRYFAARNFAAAGGSVALGDDVDALDLAVAVLIGEKTAREALTALDVSEMLTLSPICFDPEQDGEAYVAGCRAVTGAFCLAALLGKAGVATHHDRRSQFHALVEQKVATLIDRWSSDLVPAARASVAKLLSADPARQITTLPVRVLEALGSKADGIDDSQVVELGAMSVMGWLAYTIYDDFMDSEGNPALMPVANRAHVQLAELIYGEPGDGTFPSYANEILDEMAAANAWEMTTCRFAYPEQLGQVAPDYAAHTVLAARASGHGLGWAALWMRLGQGPAGREFLQMAAFFRHFLIARQLNDEAHDWEEDLRRGHVNAVAAMLLGRLPRAGQPNPDSYLADMRDYFWRDLLPEVCSLVEAHLAGARTALEQCSLVEVPAPLLELLGPVEVATSKAKNERTRTLDFLGQFE